MTLKEFRLAADSWKVKLGLADYRFEIRRAKPSDMEGSEYVGHAFWKPEFQDARILLRKDATLHDLVHEMLHVRLESHLPAPREYDPLYERGINAITDALVGFPEPGPLTEN